MNEPGGRPWDETWVLMCGADRQVKALTPEGDQRFETPSVRLAPHTMNRRAPEIDNHFLYGGGWGYFQLGGNVVD